MIDIILNFFKRNKTPLCIMVAWVVVWGWREALTTITLLSGFMAFAMVMAYLVSREMFSTYRWDIRERLNLAWQEKDASMSRLAIAMLFARVLVYIAIIISMALVFSALFSKKADASDIPARAYQYFPILAQEHQQCWPQSDIGVIGAQITHESRWKENAIRHEASGVTSYGGLQVLDVTLNGMKKQYPILTDVTPVKMLQFRYGIRAGLLYDLQMWNLCSFTSDVIERYAFTLAAYNGGYGWILRDRKLTEQMGKDKNMWFGNVELYSKRAVKNTKINRDYARDILLHAEEYRKAILR